MAGWLERRRAGRLRAALVYLEILIGLILVARSCISQHRDARRAPAVKTILAWAVLLLAVPCATIA